MKPIVSRPIACVSLVAFAAAGVLGVACGSSASAVHGAVVTGSDGSASGIGGPGDDAGSGRSGGGNGSGDDDASGGNGGPGHGDGGDAFDDGGCVGCAPGGPEFGGVLVDGGAAFHVWAPHATAARVVGTAAGSGTGVSMSPDDGGTFTAFVPGATKGSSYQYDLTTSTGDVTRLDPYCRQLTSDQASCVLTDPSAYKWSSADVTYASPPRSSAIVYELHVASYTAAGTFAGTMAKLPDLVDLGINVIELMPINPSAGGKGTWGYGPDLWMAPNTNYGTEDDLRALVDAAHKVGIAVWLDVVMNHADGSAVTPLDCYDAPCGSDNGGLYFFPSGPYALTPYGPRPDYTQPNVANMLLTSIYRSLDDDHVDGFRWDSVSNIRAVDGSGTVPGGRALLLAANAKTHAVGALSVAEDLKGDNDITSSDISTGFDFDGQWDGFGYNVTPLLTSASDADRNIATVEAELTGSDAGDPFARLLFLEDHDTVGNGGSRLPNQIDPAHPTSLAARKRSILGGVLLLTTPGIPMLFMGEELLATGTFTDPAATLAAATTQGLAVRTFYHDMIALRKTLPDLAGTRVTIVQRNPSAHVIAYKRGATLVVVNLSSQAFTEYDVGVPNAGAWNVRLNTDSDAYGSDFGGGATGPITAKSGSKDGQPYFLPLVLGAYSAVVVTPP